MSSQTSQDVYIQESFSEPMSGQHAFSSTFDLDDPAKAAAEYSRIMHSHTMKQIQTIDKSDHRSNIKAASSLSSESSTDSNYSTSSEPSSR